MCVCHVCVCVFVCMRESVCVVCGVWVCVHERERVLCVCVYCMCVSSLATNVRLLYYVQSTG